MLRKLNTVGIGIEAKNSHCGVQQGVRLQEWSAQIVALHANELTVQQCCIERSQNKDLLLSLKYSLETISRFFSGNRAIAYVAAEFKYPY